MKITTISVLPEIFKALGFGVIDRAVQNGLASLQHLDLRDFTADKHRTVDDRPYGGGPGMVMMVEPLRKAILHAKKAPLQAPKPFTYPLKGKLLIIASLNNPLPVLALYLLLGAMRV